MLRLLIMAGATGLTVLALASPVAAQDGSVVHVGLLDMTAMVSGSGAPGFGMGPQQGRGFGMMGSGYGMMGGSGYGAGMMGGGMMSIRADQTSFKAGKITFDVTNYSRSLIHELLLVAVDSPDAPLPYDYQAGRVVEDQVKSLGETGELQPNQTKVVTFDLAPGSYLLVCNVAGHFAAGMVTPITVTQ